MTNFVGIYKNDCKLAPIGALSELIFHSFWRRGFAAPPKTMKIASAESGKKLLIKIYYIAFGYNQIAP